MRNFKMDDYIIWFSWVSLFHLSHMHAKKNLEMGHEQKPHKKENGARGKGRYTHDPNVLLTGTGYVGGLHDHVCRC